MTLELKRISSDAVPRALDRAERYRLLNEPWEAESICRDVLAVDPGNQVALVTLLLSLTDQFGGEDGSANVAAAQARAVLDKLTDAYDRTYYEGVIGERWAKALLREGASGHSIHDWIAEAMRCYEKAQSLSSPGNDDAMLRWNACARILAKHDHVRPHDEEDGWAGGFADEVPRR